MRLAGRVANLVACPARSQLDRDLQAKLTEHADEVRNGFKELRKGSEKR